LSPCRLFEDGMSCSGQLLLPTAELLTGFCIILLATALVSNSSGLGMRNELHARHQFKQRWISYERFKAPSLFGNVCLALFPSGQTRQVSAWIQHCTWWTSHSQESCSALLWVAAGSCTLSAATLLLLPPMMLWMTYRLLPMAHQAVNVAEMQDPRQLVVAICPAIPCCVQFSTHLASSELPSPICDLHVLSPPSYVTVICLHHQGGGGTESLIRALPCDHVFLLTAGTHESSRLMSLLTWQLSHTMSMHVIDCLTRVTAPLPRFNLLPSFACTIVWLAAAAVAAAVAQFCVQGAVHGAQHQLAP